MEAATEAALHLALKLLIAQVVGIIGISIAYGYHRMGFLKFVRRLLEITSLVTLSFIAILMVVLHYVHPLMGFFIFPLTGMFVLSALEQSDGWGFVLGLSCVPLLLGGWYLVAVVFALFPLSLPEGAGDIIVTIVSVGFMALIYGTIGVGGAALGKKAKLGWRIESIGSRIREVKEQARGRQRRMSQFRATLDRWDAEGYSEVKGVIGIKSLEPMEQAFREVERKIERLKAVESTLNKLFQDVSHEEAVFKLEIESIRSKLKNLSKVDEVESEIKNLKDALAEHCRIKKEILDMIAEVVERKM